MTTGVRLELDGIAVEPRGMRILDVPALELPAARTTAVLGANGAGKSTLLRVAAGLRRATRGTVRMDGRPASEAELRRASAAVLQRPLLGRGSARRNAELGLRFTGVRGPDARRRAAAWLDRLGVGHLAERPAHRLSGGEAQRISLARAFALEPRLLVLDEPFAALDAATRGDLLAELRAVLAGTGTTTLLVTHDPSEAAALADRVAVLDRGVVRQHDETPALFAAPADAGVARLLGYENVLPGEAAARIGGPTHPVAFRAADLEILGGDGPARVVRSVPAVGMASVTVELDGVRMTGTCHDPAGLELGTRAYVRLSRERSVRVGGA